MRKLAILLILAASACNKPAPSPAEPQTSAVPVAPAPAAARNRLQPVEPIAPGKPGGLPDDRTPVSEAPFTPTSPQGAADVMQVYYALIGEGRYAEARRLWTGGGQGSNLDEAAFIKSFDAYDSYRGLVGAPGRTEGAAGSMFIEVPVQVTGRRRDGAEVHLIGKAVLRRVNDVPGSSPEDRKWHISSLDLQTARP